MWVRSSPGLALATLTAGLLAVSSAAIRAQELPEEARRHSRTDLEIVDCALPGQVRVLGGRTYISPRKPTRTTVADCRIRGGEYVAYDRANLQTALKVWLESAQLGDVEAQTTVGEIYERGMGTAPDFAQAADWYQKAVDTCADKSSASGCPASRALFNLGTLYERGLGVGQDPLKALELYRQSSGIDGDSLIFKSAQDREIARVRAELESLIRERDAQIEVLNQQVESLEAQLRIQGAASARQIDVLKGMLIEARRTKAESEERLARLPPVSLVRDPAEQSARVVEPQSLSPVVLKGLNMGRYYALVIGNQDYVAVERLVTPRRDAQRAAALLRDKYGFKVTLLEDANNVTMLQALNDLNGVLKPEDNLLIYYAGHGERLQAAARQAGYWLGVNADPPPNDTFWVPNEQVTLHLGRLPARRVLVVADSCYAGLLSDDPNTRLLSQQGDPSLEYVKYKLPKQSRLLISSGGDQPVLDQGGGDNSVFARAFLEVLNQNQAVLTTAGLFVRLQEKLRAAEARTKFPQTPEYKAIKSAGHETGDFFFVPVGAK